MLTNNFSFLITYYALGAFVPGDNFAIWIKHEDGVIVNVATSKRKRSSLLRNDCSQLCVEKYRE